MGKSTNTGEMILDGLKTLEYRGYDSWGIAIKKGNKLEVEKKVGKIGDSKITLGNSEIGVGHTRWATHGGVTVENAHPHLDCKNQIAVVHNGIIENFEELKKELIKKGHKFISETDTEVFPHLIEENLKKEGFASSVRDSFNVLKGLNAFVVVYAVSKEIIAVKNGSPLVVGLGKDGLFISSDSIGLIKYTRDMFFLKDNQMIILGEKPELLELPGGTKLPFSFERIDWKIEEVSMGKYKHFMIKEIFEQPKVIRKIASEKDEIGALGKVIKNSRGTFFIGAGTAYYAAIAGAYFFSKIAQKHVNTQPASEFNYLEDFLTDESLIIALSQSGETIDVVEPLQRAKTKGSKIASITNVLGSTIYRMSDYKLLLNAGPEKAVASTKAYVAKLSVLLMLAYSMNSEIDKASEVLLKAADEIDRLLEHIEDIKRITKSLSHTRDIYLIGRGLSYSLALEGAMKIKEVSYVHAEGFAGGELKHGPIALISKNTPCIVLAPNDETYGAIMSNAAEVKARGGMIIGLSYQNSSLFDHFIEIKDIQEGSIIAQIVPLQLIAYFLTLLKKYDPDKPRNLAKSVTVK